MGVVETRDSCCTVISPSPIRAQATVFAVLRHVSFVIMPPVANGRGYGGLVRKMHFRAKTARFTLALRTNTIRIR